MILSDKSIYKYLDSGELIIDPLEKGQVQPASVDIRLGRNFCLLYTSCMSGTMISGMNPASLFREC